MTALPPCNETTTMLQRRSSIVRVLNYFFFENSMHPSERNSSIFLKSNSSSQLKNFERQVMHIHSVAPRLIIY